MTEFLNGEVDLLVRCGKINPAVSHPIKCGGFVVVSWFETLVHDRWCRKTECMTCHDRTFKHISMARKTDDVSGELECPKCHVFVSKILLFRGELVCKYCMAEAEGIYDVKA